MGHVIKYLFGSENDTEGNLRIEINSDGMIHIHSGPYRFDLTPSEFRQFARIIILAIENFHKKEMQGYHLKRISLNSASRDQTNKSGSNSVPTLIKELARRGRKFYRVLHKWLNSRLEISQLSKPSIVNSNFTSKTHREQANLLFEQLNIVNIPYVVLRSYDKLPEQPNTDVDILFDNKYENEILSIMHELHFASHSSTSDRGNGGHCKMKYWVFHTLGPADQGIPNGYFRFDLYNSLHFKSPYSTSAYFTAGRQLEEDIFRERRQRKNFYIPAVEHKIVGLVCRAVFDLEGRVPQKYERQIYSETYDLLKLSHALNIVFLKAGDIVLEMIENKQLGNIRPELLKFSDY